jgi:salicylate hydroxylase
VLAGAGYDSASALAAYERLRRPRVAAAAREARRNLALYELEGLPATLRNAVLTVLPARLHLPRLDWLYGRQPD